MPAVRAPLRGDVAIAGALAAYGLVEGLLIGAPAGWLAVVVVVCAALAWRRRYPLAVVAFALVVMYVPGLLTDDNVDSVLPLPLIILCGFTAGHETPSGRLAVLAALAIGAVSVAGIGVGAAENTTAEDVVALLVLVGGSALAGYATRVRQAENRRLRELTAQLAAERDLRARAAVAEERARVARELHDIVAHSVSLIAVQAGAAEELMGRDEARTRAALRAVQETARSSLGEMRRLLGVLRADGDAPGLAPQPGLAALEELVAGSGLPVSLHVDGERPELAPGVDLSAFRIVQEALTNVRRHAGAVPTDVRVSYSPGAVEVEVSNADAAAAGAALNGRGYGLAGMRERARIYGGTLDVERGSGRFTVRARLPVGRAGGVIRTLVVDDQALVRGGLAAMLEAQPDIDVVGEAADGADAVEQARLRRPDVVLMDIRMPRMDGIEATRRLSGGPDAPRILVLTTFDADEYVYDAMRAGAAGFLLKDTPPARLAEGIRTVAAGEALLGPTVTRRLIEHYVRRPPPAELGERFAELTERELDILRHVARGLSNGEIASLLFLSEATVKTHVTRILAKLGLRGRVQAVVLAYESGLVEPGAA